MFHADQDRVQREAPVKNSLYSPAFEHDNCGIGAVVNIKGFKSHATVENALTIVETLEHRAGKDAEGKTGDGVGILLQISDRFFQKTAKQLNIPIASKRDYAVGMFFFPANELRRNQAKKMFEIIAEKEGVKVLAWREVPCDPSVLGSKARACMPHIMQCFINRPQNVNRGIDFDRKLYVARRFFEQSNEDTYVVSLSSRTIVYKGMFLVGDLRNFYLDLQDPDYESAIALVHSRFSTNTFPSWQKAHPNRMIVHNGEINTIKGNSDKMLAREENMASEHLMGDMDKVLPVVNPDGRIFGDERNGLATCRDDHYPRAVGQQPRHAAEGARFLPILRHDDGALGRSRVDFVFRRRRDGSGARPQRLASLALLHHRR